MSSPNENNAPFPELLHVLRGDFRPAGLFYEPAVLLLGLLVFVYAFLRAVLLPLSHDEAVVFLQFLSHQGSFKEVLLKEITNPSGNLLYTVFLKLLTPVAGYREIVLRLPALAGYWFYFAGIFEVLRRMMPREMMISGAAVLLCAPPVLDYFSCALGYSWALAFAVWSVYFYLRRLESDFRPFGRRQHYTTLSIWMLVGMLLFRPSFMPLALALFFLQVRLEIRAYRRLSVQAEHPEKDRSQKRFFKIILPLFCFILLVLFLLGAACLAGARSNEPSGDAVLSPFSDSLVFSWAGAAAATGLLLGWMLKVLKSYSKLKGHAYYLRQILKMILICLPLTLLGMIFSDPATVKTNPFLFFPLLGLLLFLILLECLRFILKQKGVERANVWVVLLTCAVLFCFADRSNPASFSFSDYNPDTPQMLTDLTYVAKTGIARGYVTLGAPSSQQPVIFYYRKIRQYDWLAPFSSEGTDGEFDFYFLTPNDGKLPREKSLRLLRRYPRSGSLLAEWHPA